MGHFSGDQLINQSINQAISQSVYIAP